MGQLIYADIWESVAAAVPEHTAQIRGTRRISWRDFDRRADAVARHLLDEGLRRQSKVAAYLYNAPEYLETYFAAFKAGLAPFNTNYRYGGDELLYLFENADAEAVVFHASFAQTIEKIRARLPRVRTWISVPEVGYTTPDWAVDYETIATQKTGRVEARWGRSADDLVLLYTGGTTGKPKGVMWRQADLFQGLGGGANLVLSLPPLASVEEAGQRALAVQALGIPGWPSVTIPAAPLMHATAQCLAISTLSAGGTIVTLPSNRFRADELFDEVERVAATGVVMVGMAFAVPMLEILEANPGRWKLPSLRRIMSSGTIWSAENKQGFLRLFPELMLLDSLGSSEALGIGGSATSTATPGETAKFMSGANAAVFSEDGRRVAPGSGERGLIANGGFIPVGYYKDEVQTEKTFRQFEGTRWAVPGDWATVAADGSIMLLGRGSLVINTGGEKVFPEEVEEALKRYPGVRDAGVIGLPDPRFGERICAVVDVHDGVDVTLAILATHVKESLAAYKAPRELVISKLTRQPNGKLDYAAVRAVAIAALR
jgi:acyl-CoA synthetase (AMP-forming)/AMP-acid ligase II